MERAISWGQSKWAVWYGIRRARSQLIVRTSEAANVYWWIKGNRLDKKRAEGIIDPSGGWLAVCSFDTSVMKEFFGQMRSSISQVSEFRLRDIVLFLFSAPLKVKCKQFRNVNGLLILCLIVLLLQTCLVSRHLGKVLEWFFSYVQLQIVFFLEWALMILLIYTSVISVQNFWIFV